jgi:hypothetical protein
LKLEISGAKTVLFKPGMPFEVHVYVMYDDDFLPFFAILPEKLSGANMIIRPVVTTSNGQLKTLAEVTVSAKCEYFNNSKGSNKNLPEEEPYPSIRSGFQTLNGTAGGKRQIRSISTLRRLPFSRM